MEEKLNIQFEEIFLDYIEVLGNINIEDIKTGDKVYAENPETGEKGLKEVTYKVKYQNDIEIERTFISEEIVRQPVDKIIQIYTKVSPVKIYEKVREQMDKEK